MIVHDTLIATLILSIGISAYLSIVSFTLGIIGYRTPIYLIFSFLCLCMAGLQYTELVYVNADTVDLAVQAMRWKIFYTMLFIPGYYLFTTFYVEKYYSRSWLLALTSVALIGLLINAMEPFTLRYDAFQLDGIAKLPWGESIPNFRVGISGVARVYYLLFLLIFVWSIFAAITQYRNGTLKLRKALMFIMGPVALIASAIVGALIDNNVISFVHIGGFAFMVFVILMSWNLVLDLREQNVQLISTSEMLKSEIKVRKYAEQRAEFISKWDQLTGLPNRAMLLEYLSLEEVAARNEYSALLLVNLDRLQIINETLGHHVGDEILKQAAYRLFAYNEKFGMLARFSGDEFLINLKSLGDDLGRATRQAGNMGERILHLFRQPYLIDAKPHIGSVSVGLVVYQAHEDDINDVLKRVDMAMRGAKLAGRNTMKFFEPAMEESLQYRTRTERELRHALDEGQFEVFYQKRVRHDGNIIGAEALLRWNHPGRGLICPLEFIPIAEETGLIVPIGKWVVEEVCRQLKKWEGREKTGKLIVSVNVSGLEFAQKSFVANLRRILDETRINPSLLLIEVTESMLMDNVEDAIVKMNELRHLGVTFGLDDFGTGYSSLSYLKRLPINELKIDKSFVQDLGVDPNDEAIIRTIIEMSKSLGMNVIAEGVENASQRNMLEKYGCYHYQGYLFGKPVKLEIFEQELI